MSGVATYSIIASAMAAVLVVLADASAALPAAAQPAPPGATMATAQASPGAAALAPDFTRDDLAGHTLRLSDYRGQIVLLNFWATWCEPCLEEIRMYSRWQREHGVDGLQVLGISMDDDPAAVVDAVRNYQIPYPVVIGDAHLGNLYGGVLGLPLSYLVDSSGRIVARYQGEAKLSALEARLRTLLPRWRE
jgi:cytochrome c biogenesis protein CcmG, thiol:disulfide interchange protein DsbE